MMQRYRLKEVYKDLSNAFESARYDRATAALGEALDTTWPGCPNELELTSADKHLCGHLRYRGFKPAELVMLAADVKRVVKFEDIPIEKADAFVARHRDHYELVVTPPYLKDYLMLRTRPTNRGVVGATVTIYASRDDTAQRLAQLEASDREAIHQAGMLLGYPECCVAAFEADFARSRQQQDTLNDDATIRLLKTVSDGPGHPALNPLSDLELLSFYPCSLRCDAAIAYAAKVAGAISSSQPNLVEPIREALQRPVLFWRLPFFATFDGDVVDGQLHYRAFTVNAFPNRLVRRIQGLLAAHLVDLLGDGDRIRIDGGTVVVLSGDRELRRLHPSTPGGPNLLWLSKFTDTFF
jgi:hypothetical protein